MNKYKITTLLFILIIGFICVATILNNGEALVGALKSENPIDQINGIYNDKLAYSEEFINVWSMLQNASDAELLDDVEYGTLVKDSTGNIYFPAHGVDVSTYAKNTVSLANKLNEKGIDFAYIQAPNKALKGYSDDIVFEYNFSNQDADDFIEILADNNVNTLDLREMVLQNNIPVDELFYKTDHHWTTQTAFWAFGEIVSYLNNKFELNIDSEYANLNNYTVSKIEECFLGSLGRRVGSIVSGIDDYTFIEPNFATSYKIYDGKVSTTTPAFEGSFREAIVKEKILNSTDVTTNKHATYFEWDYGNLIIKNMNIDNDKKILLIKDSYSLPAAAFLSTCVSELHMVDLREVPPVNIEEYVEKNDFDAVLIMYNTEVFNDTMFKFN